MGARGSAQDGYAASVAPQCLTVETPVAISDTAASNGTAFSVGLWEVRANVDCYVLQGTSATDATTNSWFLPAGEAMEIYVAKTGVDDYLSAICDTGVSGTMYYRKK